MALLDPDARELEIVPQQQTGPFGLVATPFQFLVTGEDHLELAVYNSVTGVTVDLHLRFLEASTQTIKATRTPLVPNTDRTRTAVVVPLAEGAILNARIVVSGATPQLGQTFAIVRVVRGLGAARIALGTLIQGYITSNQDLAWPGSPIQNSLGETFAVRAVLGTNPAAGVEIAELLPVGARWDLLAVTCALTTDATAVERAVVFQIEMQFPTPPISIVASANQPASTTHEYTFAQGCVINGALTTTWKLAPLPQPMLLVGGGNFKTTTVNLQAGDNWAAPVFLVREWLEVP